MTNTDHQFSVTSSRQNVVDEIHWATGLSKSRIKDAMTKGAVWMTRNGKSRRVRRHLADAGFPVLGDRQYGDGSYPELQLCAVGLGFNCPVTGEAVYWELPSHYHP